MCVGKTISSIFQVLSIRPRHHMEIYMNIRISEYQNMTQLPSSELAGRQKAVKAAIIAIVLQSEIVFSVFGVFMI